MNKEALKKKIAEILGVSESEKDLAFEMMLKKLSEILNYDEAINIPDIGVFSLKKEPLLREERSEKTGPASKRNLIFLPDENDTAGSSKSMYLTFNLDNTNQDYLEFDETVFSISVDKPVVSVNGIKSGNASNENSEQMLATLEEKVQKLVANTEKIPDYDIWNEFASKENISEKETEEQTDISQDEDLKKIVSENVENNIIKENKSEELETAPNSENIVDETNDSNLGAKPENESIEETRNEADSGLLENDEQTVEEPSTEVAEETNVEKPESDESNSVESDEKSSEEADKNSDDSEEIDWDWGDELKEELEADASPINEEDSETEETDEDKVSELFDPIENENVEEESDNTVEDSEKDEDVENDETEKGQDATQTVMYTPEDFEAEQEKKGETKTGKKKFEISKTLWSLIGAFVLIGIIGIYFLFFTGDETSKVNKNVIPDTLIHKRLRPVENNNIKVKNKEKTRESTGENVVEKETRNKSEVNDEKDRSIKPASDNQFGSLYRTFPDEKQVRNLIFYQNGKYSIQVSSRRSKIKAEQYAKKLRNVGYNAFIVKTYLSKLKSTWYRIRIGFFNSIKEAMNFRIKNKF